MSSILPLHRLSEVAYKRPKKTLTDTLQDEDVIQQKLEDYSEVEEADIDAIPIGSTVRYIKWDIKNNCERFILGGNIIRISNEYIVIQGKDNGTFSAQRYTRDKNGKIIHTTRFFKLNDVIDKYKARIIELEAEVKKLKETIRKLRQ
jgi:cell division protein FtsB